MNEPSWTRSDFLSDMSHEVRGPLNAVLGFTGLLLLRDLPEDAAADVAHIARAGRRLHELIDKALDIARVEAGHLALASESVCLPQTLADIVSAMKPLAGERHVQLRSLVDDHAHVRGDSGRVDQVLVDLLSNAVKFNRPGGCATIEAVPDGDRVRISVRDTGRGIPHERLDRIFEPFERLKGDSSGIEGAGLGLAVSRALVQLMGGSLAIESTEGEGTTATVELARAEPEHGDTVIDLEEARTDPAPGPVRACRSSTRWPWSRTLLR